MQGVAGVLAALRYRDQHHIGQLITADMMSSSMFLMAHESSYALNIDAKLERSRAGIAHVNQSAPYGVYETKDGAIVISTFGGVPMVRKLAAALGIFEQLEPYLTERGLRFERDEVAGRISAVLAELTTKEAIALIEPTGTWSVPVRSLAEALEDPAVAASGIVKTYETPYGGTYRVVTEGLKMSATPITSERPAPAHGEHSREVLTELGYAPARIEEMFASSASFERTPA